MIKKYTFLIFIGIFLLIGVKSVYAMPVAGDNNGGLRENCSDSVFFRGEDRMAFRSLKQPGIFSDDSSFEEQTVWATNGLIYIRSVETVDVQVYTITGQLSKQLKVTGEMIIPMPKGLYLVRLGSVVRKVVVR